MQAEFVKNADKNQQKLGFDIFGLNNGNAASAHGVVTKEGTPTPSIIYNTEIPINVCAYCRVSTDKRDQTNSFEAQQAYFNEAFKLRENWTRKHIFADKGISGTLLEQRPNFNKMIKQAKQHPGYKLIITKSVSRFSRSVRNTLDIVKDLRDAGVYVWFITDKICTDSKDYEDEILAAATAAQTESRIASERVRWGQRFKMQQGVIFGRKEMFGYNIIKDETTGKQHFEIIPEEAEIVQRIFSMYADGLGTFKIARRLENEGIKTKRYKNGWSASVILKILRNEKYVGDLKQGKTFTENFLTHKKLYNHGQYAMHFAENHHPESAIISRELWNIVQKKLEENTTSDETKKKHSNRYWCSGKVFCGECGARYVSHIKHLKNGDVYKSWKCWESQQYGIKKQRLVNGAPIVDEETGEVLMVGCNSQSVNDKVLKQGIYDILDYFIRPNMHQIYEQLESKILNREKNGSDQTTIESLEAKLEKLNNELGKITRHLLSEEENDIFDRKSLFEAKKSVKKEIDDTESELKELLENEKNEENENAEILSQLEHLKQIVELKNDKISEELYRSIIAKIQVHNNHILKYYLCGLDKPIVLQYKTSGRLESFKIEFDVLLENN